MDNEKIEIKIQSRWEYYLELIKKKFYDTGYKNDSICLLIY